MILKKTDNADMETLPETRTFAEAEINRKLTPADKINLLREKFRIWCFEQAALKHYHAGTHMGGFLHLYIGQETK